MRTLLKMRAGPDGVHLFSRRTGTNVLIDECSVPQNLWSQAPRQVSIALTNACDLRCPYCYAPKNPANLNSEQVQAWLHELDEAGCLYVGFGGGEPTLHRNFVELCKFTTRNTRLAVSFTTHAHHLNDQIASDLKGNVQFIRVSMDGVSQTYTALRGRDFAALQDRLGFARRIAPFGINYLINARTFPDINAAMKLAEEAGASELLLLPERRTGNSEGIDPITRRALRNWVANAKSGIRMAVSEADSDGLPVCQPLKKETGLRAFAHIDASGTLKRSSFDITGTPIGPDGILHALQALQQRSEDMQ